MIKLSKQSIVSKFSKGFENQLSPTLINLLIILSLIIILALTYLKNRKLELFICPPDCVIPTNPNVNKYIEAINTNTEYKKILSRQESKINDLSTQFSML